MPLNHQECLAGTAGSDIRVQVGYPVGRQLSSWHVWQQSWYVWCVCGLDDMLCRVQQDGTVACSMQLMAVRIVVLLTRAHCLCCYELFLQQAAAAVVKNMEATFNAAYQPTCSC